MARLPLAAVLWIAPENPAFVMAVLAAAGLSDFLDGRLARRSGRAGQGPGVWLDPLCDKTFMASLMAAVGLVWQVPILLIALLFTRELVQGLGFLVTTLLPSLRRRARVDLRASFLGKASTVGQFLSAGALLAWPAAALPVALTTGALGFASGTYYVYRSFSRAGRVPCN